MVFNVVGTSFNESIIGFNVSDTNEVMNDDYK